MVMHLEKVVPFGRTFEEYVKIFALKVEELEKKILGVGDGPASFNATATSKGYNVISIDPVYEFNAAEIERRFYQVVDGIIEQVKATPKDWVWSYHRSADDLRDNRMKALNIFLRDYDRGKEEGRYIIEELPRLSFTDNYFDIALCSHFLFLYSDHLDYNFHRDSILEMLRVSGEVRIFPLLTLMLERSPHLNRIIHDLTESGYRVTIEPSLYELQKGANQYLKISHA